MLNVKMVLFIVLFLFLSATSEVTASSNFSVRIDSSGSYRILVDGISRLNSGDTEFYQDGRFYSTSDGSLKLLNVSGDSGYDVFGQWRSTNFTYMAGSLIVMTSIKTYQDKPMAVFTQRYLGNATRTSVLDYDRVISKFPTFKLENTYIETGYLSYYDTMVGYFGLQYGRFQQDAEVPFGILGGPLVLFDNKNVAMVISPMSQFMAASTSTDSGKQINWGIMGLVDSVPQDYSVDFIIYYSDQGINQAMRGWGDTLKKLYNKTTAFRVNDVTLSHLGYWTDNGAYYYYNTVPSTNYEKTILDIDAYFKQLKAPFGYWQFDDWWYFKGHINGTKIWRPLPDVFPDGFLYLNEKTKLPIGCHNKYWDSDTIYAKANGGDFNFIMDKDTGYSLPDDEWFWPYLFNTTQVWGQFGLYEQDFLHHQTLNLAPLLSDLFLGRRWLMQMGTWAEHFNIPIQYCSAYSRHILQALEIPAVTQARVSRDYHPGRHQWNLGVTAMFADAVGIASSKDTFWTSSNEAGSPYTGLYEPCTALQHLVATLSTGPVGPGDGIGFINESLLMRCCDTSGLILKPSKAITAIDDQIKMSAFTNYPGPDGEVYTTYSNHTNVIFGIVLAAELQNEYSLTPSSGWTGLELPEIMYVYSGTDLKMMPVPFSESHPIVLTPACTNESFCLYYTSPLFTLGQDQSVVLMGEPDKWVPLSNQRISQINQTTDDITVTLKVQAEEVVTFNFWVKSDTVVATVKCDNSKGENPVERAIISIAHKSCNLGR